MVNLTLYLVTSGGTTQSFARFEDAKAYAIREFKHELAPLGRHETLFLKKLEACTASSFFNSRFIIEYDEYDGRFAFEQTILHTELPPQPDSTRVWEGVGRKLQQENYVDWEKINVQPIF